MTEEELTALLLGSFSRDFASRVAGLVRREGAFETLYAVATGAHGQLRTDERHKLLFRSAWVVDTLYFETPELLRPFAERFGATDFPACADASARRHFTKIMAHLLGSYAPPVDALNRIAESAAAWALEPGAKVAVRCGAVEVLRRCRDRVGWVRDCWDDLLAALEHDATPGIDCRLRKSWRRQR